MPTNADLLNQYEDLLKKYNDLVTEYNTAQEESDKTIKDLAATISAKDEEINVKNEVISAKDAEIEALLEELDEPLSEARRQEIEKALDHHEYYINGVCHGASSAIETSNLVISDAMKSPYIAKTRKQLKELKKQKKFFTLNRDIAIDKLEQAIEQNEKYINKVKSQLEQRLISKEFADSFIEKVNKVQNKLKARLEVVKNAKFDIINNIKHSSFWKKLAIIAASLATIAILLGVGNHIMNNNKNNNNPDTDNQIKQEEVVDKQNQGEQGKVYAPSDYLKKSGIILNALYTDLMRSNDGSAKAQKDIEKINEYINYHQQLAKEVEKYKDDEYKIPDDLFEKIKFEYERSDKLTSHESFKNVTIEDPWIDYEVH